MVSTAVFAAFIFAAAAELALPVILLLVLCLKKKVTVVPMFLGFASFFVSQVMIRLQILNVLKTQGWFQSFAANFIPYCIMLAFTAGLFEESARLLCAGCFLKKHRMFRDAVSFGLGHGLCEVILITGMAQINNIVYTVMINSGTFQKATAALPAAQSQAILAAMQAATPSLVTLGVAERVFTVAFHIFASALVFKGVNDHKVGWYLLALGLHTIVDFGSVMLGKFGNIWIAEGFILLIAVISVFFTIRMRNGFPKQNIGADFPVSSAQS